MAEIQEYYPTIDEDNPNKILGDLRNAYWDDGGQLDIKYGEDFQAKQGVTEYSGEEAIANDPILANLAKVILDHAISMRASDLQINAWTHFGVVKEKQNGRWVTVRVLHPFSVDSLITWFRGQAKLPLFTTTTPEISGHILYSYREDTYNLRMAISPSDNGQVLTLRFAYSLDLNDSTIEDLGYPKDYIQLIKDKLNLKSGMILLSGAMGSGKSTTIRALLVDILKRSEGSRLIMSVENPVEYKIDGIVQSNTDNQHNFSFAEATTVRLREAGDVLMVGEINNEETAKAAVDTGTTGQLVVSTLHSGSAITVPQSLVNRSKGTVDWEMLANSLRLIIWQALVEKMCDNCKIDHPATIEDQKWIHDKLYTEQTVLNYAEQHVYDPESTLVRQDGTNDRDDGPCSVCGGLGTKGRVLLAEIVDGNRTFERLLRKTSGDPDLLKTNLMETEYSNYYPLENDVLRRLKDKTISLAQAKTLIN